MIKIPDIQPTLRVIPMNHDTNPRGDIFGGWLMSQIDMAGSVVAYRRAQGPVATIAVKELTFRAPLFVGDVVSLYATISAVGNTSITVDIDVYAQRERQSKPETVKISHAVLVFVAVLEPGQSRPVPQDC